MHISLCALIITQQPTVQAERLQPGTCTTAQPSAAVCQHSPAPQSASNPSALAMHAASPPHLRA